MVERVIVLPTRDNAGRSLTRQVNAVRDEILHIAGGYSETRQAGAWLDEDGTVYHDASVRLTTTVDEPTDARIVALLPEWCERLRQICLYTHATTVDSQFVYAPIPQTAIA
jgi:hypothetical protein